MASFEFRAFASNGVNVIDEWLSAQPGKVRARFDSDFSYLANVPIADWGYPRVVPLQGYDGLLEFRVRLQGWYRIGGFHGPEDAQVTLCSAWTHSESAGAQRRAMELAVTRKALVISGAAKTVLHG